MRRPFYTNESLINEITNDGVKTVGDFLTHYPMRHPVYLSIRDHSSLILLSGQSDIIKKVDEYDFINYREVELEIPRSAINKISPANIHDTHIKICIVFAIKNTTEPLFFERMM